MHVSMSVPRSLTAVAGLALFSLACTHTASLERGAVSVHFEAPATLTRAEVHRETFAESGYRFVAEYSVLPYAIHPPFQSVQAVFSVSLADDPARWSPGTADLPATMSAVLQGLPLKLPNGACEAPTADSVLGRDALEARCTASAEGVTYAMRLRVVATAHALVVQVGSWTDEGSKQLVDRFWSSIKPTEPGAVAESASSAAPVAVKFLATRVGELPTR